LTPGEEEKVLRPSVFWPPSGDPGRTAGEVFCPLTSREGNSLKPSRFTVSLPGKEFWRFFSFDRGKEGAPLRMDGSPPILSWERGTASPEFLSDGYILITRPESWFGRDLVSSGEMSLGFDRPGESS
jgi:hypothetical protein